MNFSKSSFKGVQYLCKQVIVQFVFQLGGTGYRPIKGEIVIFCLDLIIKAQIPFILTELRRLFPSKLSPFNCAVQEYPTSYTDEGEKTDKDGW